jgi:hypothetical protein
LLYTARMKKVLWSAMAAIVSVAAARLALRALGYAWERVAHEPPPPQPKWARWLVAAPLSKGVAKAVPTPYA